MALPIDPVLLVPAVAVLLIAAAISDIRRFVIPNWICLALVALFAVRLIAAGADGQPVALHMISLALALGVFVAGATAFHRGWLGGGDVKLLAATSLWMAPVQLLDFLVLVALLGGVLALIVFCCVWIRQHLIVRHSTASASASVGLPYGVAISAAGVLILFDIQTL